MTKHLRYLCTLLLFMVASVGWAEELFLNFSCTNGNTPAANGIYMNTSEGTFRKEIGDVKYIFKFIEGDHSSITHQKGQNAIQLGSGTKPIGDYVIAFQTSLNNISKVVIKAYANGGASLSVGIGDESGNITKQFSTEEGNSVNVNVSTSSSGTYTFTGDVTTGNLILCGSVPNKYLRIESITITYTPGGSGTETVATPTFSPAAGTYSSAQDVTISCGTSGATIYYTTDGSTPTTSDAVYSTPINVSASTTIKAIAVKDQMENSAVASATYTIVEPFVIEDGVFDFECKRCDYGSGVTTTSDGSYIEQDKTWIAGNVTLVTSGKYRWWDNDGTLRFYNNDPASAMTISVPDGKVVKSIVITGGQAFTASLGTYANGTWTGQARSVTLSYAASSGSVNVKTVTVTYEDGTPAVEKIDIATLNGISPTTLTVGDLDEFTLDATFAEDVTASDYTITWESSNTDVLELANETYEAKAAGTANVTVTITPNDTETYNAVSKTFTVTVNAAPVVIGLPFYESFDTNDGTGGNDNQWSGSIASNAFKSDHEGWTTENVNGANLCVKAGAGSKKGSLTTPELPFVEGKNYVLTFKAAAWNGNSEGTTLTIAASSATPSNAEVTMTKGAWTEYTVYLNNATGAGTVTFAAKNASNNRFFLDEVRIEETDVITVAAPTFSLPDGTYIGARSVEIICAMNEANIYYTLDGSEPTAQSTAYSSAITINENTILKAIAVIGENVSEIAVAEYTIVVPVHAGTEADPYTTADANLVAAANPTNVYVKGIISRIKSIDVSQYTRAQYYISDDGTEENEFYVYNGLYLNGEDFTANDQIQIGDEVVVLGNLIVYNGTKEFAANNYIVTLNRYVTIDEADYVDEAYAPIEKYANVTFKRTLVEGWNGLVLPFDMTVEDAKAKFNATAVKDFTGVTYDSEKGATLNFSNAEEIKAGKPFMIKAAAGKEYTFSGVLLKSSALQTISQEDGDAKYIMTGTYQKVDLTNVNFVLIQGDKYYQHNTNKASSAKAFRAYFVNESTGEAASKGININFDGEATGIELIENGQLANDQNGIYNLQGQKVNAAQKGIYIVNGKKIVVK